MAESDGIGTDLIAVKEEKGQVIIVIPPGTSWVALDPETARNLSINIAEAAYKGHYGIAPQPAASQFTDMKRNMLVRRIEVMLTGFIVKVPKMSPKQMAVAITDTLLAEVL